MTGVSRRDELARGRSGRRKAVGDPTIRSRIDVAGASNMYRVRTDLPSDQVGGVNGGCPAPCAGQEEKDQAMPSAAR
jgi:hypothetical protein